ncbi:MAG: hypothetical protein LH478_09480 [Chitinophagaceae bacterium]|nr:hypothetical protein [Chitinophagaceae bacterium]
MENNVIRRLALQTFAITLFCFGLYYILRAKDVAAIFSSFIDMGIVIVYFAAFLNIAIATSILKNVQVKLTCYYGGFCYLSLTVLSFVAGLLQGGDNIESAILSFILSIGYCSAIFYIGSEAE